MLNVLVLFILLFLFFFILFIITVSAVAIFFYFLLVPVLIIFLIFLARPFQRALGGGSLFILVLVVSILLGSGAACALGALVSGALAGFIVVFLVGKVGGCGVEVVVLRLGVGRKLEGAVCQRHFDGVVSRKTLVRKARVSKACDLGSGCK
jgi:hypothetical protein